MAAYFWVGGTGTWTATGNTQFATSSGGTPTTADPTSLDTVTIDANSGSGTVSIATGATCAAFDYAGTTITSVALTGNVTFITTSTVTFNSGTLSLNDFTLSTGSFLSSNTNTRVIQFGASGNITVTNGGNALNINGNNFSFTGVSTINVSNNSSTATTVNLQINQGFTETNALSVNYTTGTYVLNDQPAGNFPAYRNLNLTGFNGTFPNSNRQIYGNFTCPATGGTYTAGTNQQLFSGTSGTQTITTNGRTLEFPITQSGIGATVQLAGALTLGATRAFTFASGTLNLNNNTLTAGTFSSSGTSARVFQFGTGNITVTGSGASCNINGNNFSFTGTPTINISNNTATATTVTLNQQFTEANALNVNYTTGTYTLTDTTAYYRNLNLTGFAGTFPNSVRTIFGNFTCPATGGTYTSGANTMTFAASSGTQTISTGNRSLGFAMTFGTVASITTTFAISGAFTSTSTVILRAGTLQLTSGVTTSATTFLCAGPSTSKIVTSSTPGVQATLSLGNAAVVFTGSILNIAKAGAGTITWYGTNGGNNTGITFLTTYTGALYWVGGSGTWSATGNTKFALTSGGTATSLNPDESTPVIVNASSGNPTITLSATVPCAGLTTTGTTCTIAGTSFGINCFGSLSLASTTTWSATGTLTFLNQGTIQTNGVSLSAPITVNLPNTSLTLTLSGALTTTTSFSFLGGSLNLADFTFTCTTFSMTASANPPRAIQFGTTGNITTTAAGTPISLTGFGFSHTGNPTINVSNNSATGAAINALNFTEQNALNFNITTGTYSIVIANNGFFKSLNFTGFAGTWASGTSSYTFFGNLTLVSGMTYTTPTSGAYTFANTSGTATITSAGKTFFRITQDTPGGTVALSGNLVLSGSSALYTFTSGTLNLANNFFTTSTFSSNVTNTREIQFGATGQITVFASSGNSTFNVNGTNFTYTGTSKVIAVTIPVITTTTGFTETNALNFVINANNIITLTSGSVFKSLDFTGSAGGIWFPTSTSNYTFYGSLTFVSIVNYSAGTGAFTFANTSGTATITSVGKTLNPITVSAPGGTVAFFGTTTLGSEALTFTAGTLRLSASNTTTVGSFVTTGTTLKFLTSSTPGTQATLSDASGTNAVTYLSIQDSNATGGAIFNATDPTNVNAGNNTGWLFAGGGSNYFLLF
jgi:hypothetical protein